MTLDQDVRRPDAFQSSADLDLDAFVAICAQALDPATVPTAASIDQNVPIFEASALWSVADDDPRVIMAELNGCLLDGPGAFAVRGLVDPLVVDDATTIYREVIAAEQAAGLTTGDHFAAPGSNDRLWNSFQKLAEQAPETFTAYFANAVLDLVCQAWLGPAYRMTAQVNVVYPGGAAQRPHRDYHLGFLPDSDAARYPIPMHRASALLTLQGAVAHSDMPVESGPTRLLPFSHQYPLGFMAYRDPRFEQHFAGHFVQIPLRRGDGLFFNPALFHAAGDNRTTDVARMANLMQVSSAFGKPMETINTAAITITCYPNLRALYSEQGFSAAVEALMTMVADGYPFPANVDITPPLGGLAPASQRDLLRQALAEHWPADQLQAALTQQIADRRA
jgi:ectoine hydroxylase-related dioxygenase (phytanoyl-CoA dioxygenase family)